MKTKEKTQSDTELPATMRAARVHHFGGPEVIRIEDVSVPLPDHGEVLVRVTAAGVGPWDGWIRSGRSVLPQPLPLTLGSDLSGIVSRVGPDVVDFKVGDIVFGVTNKRFTDAHAEYAIAKVSMIALKPDSINEIEAASLPVIAVTAWQALFDHAHLKSGQKVLIHGGAGGVGAYAVQFAKHAGAHVITTVGTADVPYAQNLGADEVLDYSTVRFENTVAAVDAVIDLVGGDTQARSFTVLKKSSTLISTVSQPDQDTAKRYDVRASFFLVDVSTEALNSIAKAIGEKDMSIKVGKILPLEAVAQAHEMLEGKLSNPGGKIVISVLDC